MVQAHAQWQALLLVVMNFGFYSQNVCSTIDVTFNRLEARTITGNNQETVILHRQLHWTRNLVVVDHSEAVSSALQADYYCSWFSYLCDWDKEFLHCAFHSQN